MILLQAIFWFSLFLIFHTYILFPSILQLLAPAKKQKNTVNLKDNPDTREKLPFLSVLIAAFNEEEVIEAKIRSAAPTVPCDITSSSEDGFSITFCDDQLEVIPLSSLLLFVSLSLQCY